MLGIPWPGINLPILGVVPVLFLMFFVRPAGRPSNEQRTACSKCASPHTPGQNYCTKCGWDLSHQYSPEAADTILASEMHQPQATTATLERPAEATAPEAGNQAASAPEPPSQPSSILEEEWAPPEPVEVQAEAAQEEAADTYPGTYPGTEPEDAVPDDDAEPETKPWGIPVPGPAPTAEVMTARGAVFLSEGRLQEAIDQFTKAIALDPKHREAFERRAEAYIQQGRQERADEDYRQVQALNTGS